MLMAVQSGGACADRCATRPCVPDGREAPGRRGSDQATFPAREPPDALLPCPAAGCHALRRGRSRLEPARAGGHGGGPGGRPGLAGRAGPGQDGRSALVAAGAGKIRSGDPVVFLKPVAVAPAVVRRDGRVQAAGHPAEHARLGVAEERIDALAGQADVIGQIAAGVTLQGKVKGVARRAMTPALAIRFTLLMTLMPSDADYAEVMAALMGDLAAVPWQRPYALPTATVACTWREALGPGPLEQLRDLVLAGVDAEHRLRLPGGHVEAWIPARLTGR